jgi:hypothetical protein
MPWSEGKKLVEIYVVRRKNNHRKMPWSEGKKLVEIYVVLK